MVKDILIGNDDFEICDFANPMHCARLCEMVDCNITESSGDNKPLTNDQKLVLLDGLESLPSSIVIFAVDNKEIIGYATAFINFSSLTASAVMNISELYIEQNYRNKGWAVKMIEKLIDMAKYKDCNRISIEINKNDAEVQHIYSGFGFKEPAVSLTYMIKELNDQ